MSRQKKGSNRDTFVNVSYTARKALVQQYANTKDNGLSVSGSYTGSRPILIPQLDYCTNDIWELAAAFGSDNNFPIILRCRYGNGRISVITVPEDMGDFYAYPPQVLNAIRELFSVNLPIKIEGPAKAMLFLYDNNTCIVRSDLPFDETFTLVFSSDVTEVSSLDGGRHFELIDQKLTLRLMPSSNLLLRLKRD